MDKEIIINVDDFGLSRAYNYGIIDGYQQGVISSTTLLINAKEVKHAINLAKENPGLGLGLHLALTTFPAITKAEAISTNGNLNSQKYYHEMIEQIDSDVIKAELEAQIEKFIKLVGKKPTHLDMHHHMHRYAKVEKVVIELANKYQLLLRNSETNQGICIVNIDFYGENVNLKQLKKSINELTEVKSEVYKELCIHAGYIDCDVLNISSYQQERIREMAIITSEEFKCFLQKKQLKLVPFTNKKVK